MIQSFSKGQKITADGFNQNFSFVQSNIERLENVEPVPSGIICLWASSTIPPGWFLCDGQNGTPDLRDRFVVAFSEEFPLFSTGGEAGVTLNVQQIPVHSHGAGSLVAEEAGTHEHTWIAPTNRRAGPSRNVSGAWWHGINNLQTSQSGDHSHSLGGNVGETGDGLPHENMPPYYALYYIIKG